MHRVAITGAGTINALAHDVAGTFAAFREGRCGITALDLRDKDRLAIGIGGQVHDWDAEVHFNRQQIALYDKFTQFTLLAARQAIGQSGLQFADELSLRAGVVLGTAGGGVNTWDENYRAVYEEKKNRVHPFVVPKLMNNAAASHVSMEWNLRGPSFTVATACASSNHAMGLAFQMVRAGGARVMVTGGSESMLCFVARRLPPVQRQPQRHGAGRGGGRVRVRGMGPRARPRRRHPGRGGGVRDDLGRRRHRHAAGRRGRAGDARRDGGCAAEPRGCRLYQRPRHRHRRQ
jgi:hypothetical protein